MRVAILVPNFAQFSGDAQVARSQAEELARQGHQPAIFALAADMRPKEADLFLLGMPKSLLGQRAYRLLFPLAFWKTLRWLPRLKDFDLVVAHLYPMTWLAYWAKRRYGVKYTFWFHGIEEPKLFPHLHERLYTRLHIFLTRMTVGNADRIVSVSKFAQAKLKEYAGLESEVIYNKVDTTKFHRAVDGSGIRLRYGLGDAPLILNVGRLAPQKGVHLLLEAFKLIKQKIPQARLVIVGKPSFDYYLKKLRQMSDQSVVFAGPVPQEEMPQYYAMCDLYATCSLWETHNLPVLEARACGKPVVAFAIPSFQESLEEGGSLVPVGDVVGFAQACIHILAEPTLQKGETR